MIGIDTPVRKGRTRGLTRIGFHDLAYVEWGDRDARQVVICVHGLSRQGRDFDVLAEALAQLGYRVVCPDLPGRGRSGWLADPELYGPPQYALDMTVLVAHLGVESVDWIGTSLGGLVGMTLAGLPGTPIRRLVLNDIGPFLPKDAVAIIGKNLLATPRRFASLEEGEARLRTIHAGFGPLTDAQWRRLAEHSFVAAADGGWRAHFDPQIGVAFQQHRIQDVSLWEAWELISCPTLVLRGENSDLLLKTTADAMTARGPRATLAEITDCGHAPSLLEDGQVRIVCDWMGPAS